ncbi:MAG: hypothetical protein WBC68_11555 [Albidovulum sp.]
MFRLFSDVFTPKRALAIRHFLFEWGALLWMVPLILAVLLFLVQFAGRKHVFEGFVLADVQFTSDMTSKSSGTRYLFAVKMPNGEAVSLSTDNLSVANSFVHTACVEVRRYSDNGQKHYRLAPMAKCE